jgi:hypothetical protein
MNPVEAYLWFKDRPDVGSIEKLGLKEYVVAGYAIFLSGPDGLLKARAERPTLKEFEKLEGRLGESIVTGFYPGPSKGDVNCFVRIKRLAEHTREVMRKLSQQDYVKQVSFVQGYGGNDVLAELTDIAGVPYKHEDDQRVFLEEVIEPITPNFFIEPSLVIEKVI